MQPYVSGTEPAQVVDMTWVHGYHGYKEHNPEMGIYSYPPITMVEMEYRNPKFLNYLDKTATEVAKKQHYNYIKM